MLTIVSGDSAVRATGVSVIGAEATSAFLSIDSERTVIQLDILLVLYAFYTLILNLRSKSIGKDFV